jgi:hypothetical protein
LFFDFGEGDSGFGGIGLFGGFKDAGEAAVFEEFGDAGDIVFGEDDETFAVGVGEVFGEVEDFDADDVAGGIVVNDLARLDIVAFSEDVVGEFDGEGVGGGCRSFSFLKSGHSGNFRVRSESGSGKFKIKRVVLAKLRDGKHAKANEFSSGVDAFHEGVVGSGFFIAGGIGEADFEEVGFGVEPNFYFVGHRSSPRLGWSVR